VSSQDNPSPGNRLTDWPAVVRTLLVQVAVLLALACAFIGYVEWSSDRAVAEFIGAGNASVLDPNHHLQSLTPVRTAKAQATCDRRN
jgi:hypothetical protein